MFSKLYIEQDEVVDDLLHEPFQSVVDIDRAIRAERERAGAQCSIEQLAGRLAGETKKGRSTVACRRPLVSTGGQLLALAVSQGSSSRSLVEVLSAYSRMFPALVKIRSFVGVSSSPRPRSPISPGQRQVRLRLAEQLEVIDAYRSGSKLAELAVRFGVNRRTVSHILERHGVDRRYRLERPLDLGEIRRRYASGESLATIGAALGADARTIQRAMQAAGIPTRPRPGR